jgi:AcrR family transcriptional regulator
MEVQRRAPFGDSPRVGERGANTQRSILEAALEVFGKHGFHGTRVELITERAGCSRPSFYQYFSSKEDVFWHLARDLAAAINRVADSLGDVEPTRRGVEHVAEWFDSLVDVYVRYAPIFAAFPAAVRGPVAQLGDSQGISERVGTAIMAPIPHERRPDGLEALPTITVAVLLRTIHYWNAGLGQISRRRFVTGFAQTLHRLFFGPIEWVNVTSPTSAPSHEQPAMPAFPGSYDGAEALRPRGRATRDQLLVAGSTVLPSRGYHDTRVEDIVSQAGVSHGSFYRYFASKDALFGVLAERTASTLFELMASFPEPDAPGALESWLETYFASYHENGGVISVWQEIDYDDPELNDYSVSVALAAFDRLHRIVHARGFGDSEVDALVLLTIMERVPYTVEPLRYTDTAAAIEATAYFVREALFGLDGVTAA